MFLLHTKTADLYYFVVSSQLLEIEYVLTLAYGRTRKSLQTHLFMFPLHLPLLQTYIHVIYKLKSINEYLYLFLYICLSFFFLSFKLICASACDRCGYKRDECEFVVDTAYIRKNIYRTSHSAW